MWGKCGGCVNMKKLTTACVRIEKSWWKWECGDENEVWWNLASHTGHFGNDFGQPESLDQPLERQGLSGWVTHVDTSGQCRMCQECICANLCGNSSPDISYILCSLSGLVETPAECVELGTRSVFAPKINMEWIIECAELEETPRNDGVQLSVLVIPKIDSICPRELSKPLLNCVRLGAVITSWGLWSVLSHPLGENLSWHPTQTCPDSALAVPLAAVTGHESEEISVCSSPSPHKEIADCNEVSSVSSRLSKPTSANPHKGGVSPPDLWQSSWPPLNSETSCVTLCCPSTGAEATPGQSRAGQSSPPLPGSPGLWLPGHLWLTFSLPSIHQDLPQLLSSPAHSQGGPVPVQNPALALGKVHVVGACPAWCCSVREGCHHSHCTQEKLSLPPD